jgi:mannose-6-phosphate isomerase-like protein (cupin superfamily)
VKHPEAAHSPAAASAAGVHYDALMQPDTPDRVLDFGSGGMWWEIIRSTADTNGAYLEIVNVIRPGFDGPPLHIHPTAEESYAVTAGELDVCVAGAWRKVKAGETATVPAGVPHTLKNTSIADVSLVNVHRPAMAFERMFRRMHAMIAAGKLSLPPRGLGAMIRISMLFCEHEAEIRTVKPPHMAMRTLARVGKLLGFKLPA